MINEQYDAFKALLNRVLSVPHAEILRREEEYRKQVAENPHKRGPKRKTTESPAKGSIPPANNSD
jgi:hypothetical protein